MANSGLRTSDLLSAIKRRAFIPQAQNTFTDNDLLSFLNEEMLDSVVPMVMEVKEEYFGFSIDIPLEANVDRYAIPYRSIGQKVRDIKFKDSDGNLYQMTRIQPEDRQYFQGTGGARFKSFYFEGNDIVLFPGVGANPVGSLSLIVYLRPNKLVKETRVSTITGINTTTGVITVDTVPSNISVSTEVDLLQARPGHVTLAYDITPTAVDSTLRTITLDPTEIPRTLTVGDFITLAGECIIPQIPAELHTTLIERVVARCHASQGDQEAQAQSEAKIAQLEQKANNMIEDRSEGNPKKVNNLGSIIRGSRISRRRFSN